MFTGIAILIVLAVFAIAWGWDRLIDWAIDLRLIEDEPEITGVGALDADRARGADLNHGDR